MGDEVLTTTVSRVQAAAETCPEAAKILKLLFPSAFSLDIQLGDFIRVAFSPHDGELRIITGLSTPFDDRYSYIHADKDGKVHQNTSPRSDILEVIGNVRDWPARRL